MMLLMIFSRALSSEEVAALYANQSSKYLFQNFTDLSGGNHTFRGYVQDRYGNVNMTEEREVEILGNLPPSVPTLIFPNNGNHTLFDRYLYLDSMPVLV